MSNSKHLSVTLQHSYTLTVSSYIKLLSCGSGNAACCTEEARVVHHLPMFTSVSPEMYCVRTKSWHLEPLAGTEQRANNRHWRSLTIHQVSHFLWANHIMVGHRPHVADA